MNQKSRQAFDKGKMTLYLGKRPLNISIRELAIPVKSKKNLKHIFFRVGEASENSYFYWTYLDLY